MIVKRPPVEEVDQLVRPPLAEWQCALLILLLIQAREKELKKKEPKREVSRARISQNTIRRLCGRSQLTPDFVLEVQEYLLAAGWALFCIGPSYYAIVKVESVQGWSRISSKRIAKHLEEVARGEFKWEEHVGLLAPQGGSAPPGGSTAKSDEKDNDEDSEDT
jgi:hypothetical protein